MALGEHIHWYLTDRCNLQCAYCFKPKGQIQPSMEETLRLAEILAQSGVKEVTLTGGEPLINPAAKKAMEILKGAGIYVALHTNGLFLRKRVKEFEGFVDDIAIPLDTLNRKTQTSLRGFDYLSIFHPLMRELEHSSLKMGLHTVVTTQNVSQIRETYENLTSRFDYWKAYEFNADLVADRFSSERRFEQVNSLETPGTKEKGYTDGLLAQFILLENEMQDRFQDARLRFVGVKDPKPSYIFLDTNGNIQYYGRSAGSKRRILGSTLEKGLKTIIAEAKKLDTNPIVDDESEQAFVEAANDMPLWARLWEGNYLQEEIDAVLPPFRQKVQKLSELYQKRIERLEKALAA